MMRRVNIYVGFAVLVSASIVVAARRPVIAPAPAPRSGVVTFARDALPVLQKHCQSCHRPGQIGPMAFLDYLSTNRGHRRLRPRCARVTCRRGI